MAGNTLEFNDGTFAAEVLESATPVLVDFWAPWCGPCRALAPTVEAIATEYVGKVKVGKINTDQSPGVATKYGIQSIPTLMLFKNGQVVNTVIGAQPKDRITQMINAAL